MGPQPTAERVIEIRSSEGLHMRPAMRFVQRASSFASSVSLIKGDLTVDGKSIMQVTMLAATKGTQIRLCTKGPDAVEAADVLAELLAHETSETPTN
ncbi:MAG: HPr family phosphocarrier protein [Sedimentisphaerales bacterium]|nr:HPr family phosphocarrier protein [Sedimentisphaerales bacterium]